MSDLQAVVLGGLLGIVVGVGLFFLVVFLAAAPYERPWKWEKP